MQGVGTFAYTGAMRRRFSSSKRGVGASGKIFNKGYLGHFHMIVRVQKEIMVIENDRAFLYTHGFSSREFLPTSPNISFRTFSFQNYPFHKKLNEGG